MPAPEPDTSIEPPTVIPPLSVTSPMTKVPAVMAARSEDKMLRLPPAEPTDMDWLNTGFIVTVPAPALTAPANATSPAVMTIGAFVVEIDVETAFVTLYAVLPKVIVTPLVPVTLELSAIFPVPNICKTTVFPDIGFEIEIPEFVVDMDKVPLVEVTVPEVPKVVTGPVIVKFPPTDEVPSSMLRT